MSSSSPLLSNRARARKKAVLLRILVVYVPLAALLFAAVAYVSRVDSLQITAFEITGTNASDDAAVHAYVAKAAEGYEFFFFPRANIFLYPARRVAGGLLADFPQVATADISRVDFKTISVTITEKKPAGIWCGETPQSANAGMKCKFIDAGGEVFKDAPSFSESPYFIYYGRIASSTLPAPFLTKQNFDWLHSFIYATRDIFPAVSAQDAGDGDFELFTSAGTILKIAQKNDATTTIRYLKSFLDGSALGTLQGQPDKFEYIDMRFGKKVYFKLRGPAKLENASSSPAVSRG